MKRYMLNANHNNDVDWQISSEGEAVRFEDAKAAIDAAVAAERERICAAIKAEDDYCVTQGDYMLDSDDCIKVARGEWLRPEYAPTPRPGAQMEML